MKRLNPKGFTLIELMLAMTLFTLTMAIATVGFIGMNRSYTRGTVRRQLSEGTQRTIDTVAKVVRTDGRALDGYKFCSSGSITNDPGCPISSGAWKEAVCFKGVRFIWNETGLYFQNKGCNFSTVNIAEGEEILGNRYSVELLNIKSIQNSSGDGANLYLVSGVLRTQGGEETFNNLTNPDKNTITCKGSSSGLAQTCAVEKFSTVVNARGGE